MSNKQAVDKFSRAALKQEAAAASAISAQKRGVVPVGTAMQKKI